MVSLRQDRWVLPALAGVLFLHMGLLAWSATRHSPTWDEPAYLVSGWSHWKFGRFELYAVNPPLVRMVAAIPLLWDADLQMDWSDYRPWPYERSEVSLGRKFFELNGERAQWALVRARWMCLPFSLLGAGICWLWARELYGDRAGLLACSLWCFSPHILGYGELITPDVPAAACGLLACWLFRRWMLNCSTEKACWAGVGLGLALCVKSTWLILIPIQFCLAWGVGPGGAWSFRKPLSGILACWLMSVIAICMLNSAYGFQGTGLPLKAYSFQSQILSGIPSDPSQTSATELPRGNRFRDTWLGAIPIPLPVDFVHGIDLQKSDFERGAFDPNWRSYLAGTWQQGGWWYFYFVALLLKVPLAELALWGLALIVLVRQGASGSQPRSAREMLVLLLPTVCIFLTAALLASMTRYFRYVLPAIPFLMIWAAGAIRVQDWQGKLWRYVPTGLMVWLLASTLWVYPHSLSYFNELAGGPGAGGKWLLDSNVDWGQDLLELRRWMARHPEARNLKLAYFGSISPHWLGVSAQLPPPKPQSVPNQRSVACEECGPQPGWYAVSVNPLFGHPMPLPDAHGEWRYVGQPVFTYFQRFQPVDRAGYSILIYHLTEQDIASVKAQAVHLPASVMAQR